MFPLSLGQTDRQTDSVFTKIPSFLLKDHNSERGGRMKEGRSWRCSFSNANSRVITGERAKETDEVWVWGEREGGRGKT